MQRIRERAQFNAVLAGRPVASTPHFALHLSARENHLALFPVEGTWLGVLLPKRWAKRAVTRNALRRQIYAVSQSLSDSLPRAAMVVRLRSGFSRDSFHSACSEALKQAARAELLQLFDRLAARMQPTDALRHD